MSAMMFQPDRVLCRRAFLAQSTTGLGAVALASLLNRDLLGAVTTPAAGKTGVGILKNLHRPAKAKLVIYLFMSGAPSHIDLFDPKPRLKDLTNTELPSSVRMGQRITGMT